jgi:hypothetical protein
MRRLFALLVLTTPVFAADPPKPDKDGFVPLFNGKDLTGWVNVNCGPKTWTVKDGELITSGSPIGLLRTDKQYENFECEFEWMHVNTKEVGNSGFFVWCDPLPQIGGPFTRGIEVQVLVNYPKNDWATNHGDVFSVSGAKCVPDRPHPTRKGLERCLPSEERCKGGGEWNHYRVVGKDGAIKLSVNGKEVSGVSECNPRKGYLSFESEGAECHFRNVKIKELPTSNPKKEQVAAVDEGFKPLFNHTDLTGWTTAKDGWKVDGGVLKPFEQGLLLSNAKYAVGEIMFDWKAPAKPNGPVAVNLGAAGVTFEPDGTAQVGIAAGGSVAASEKAEAKGLKAGQWNRVVLTFDGKTASATVNGKGVGTAEVKAAPPASPVVIHPIDGLELRNVYVRELKADKK